MCDSIHCMHVGKCMYLLLQFCQLAYVTFRCSWQCPLLCDSVLFGQCLGDVYETRPQHSVYIATTSYTATCCFAIPLSAEWCLY